MSSVVVYLEGGGDRKESQAELRKGMDAFLSDLKGAALRKSLRWRTVACGSRQEAYEAFVNAANDTAEPIRILLVDAEEPVHSARREHLHRRDRWHFGGVAESAVHLMTQTMETWLVADPNALSMYYGQKFRLSALPKANNLELVSKKDVGEALRQATRDTTKGAYHKIRHIRALLSSADPRKVRTRCTCCDALFSDLHDAIDSV